MKAKKHLLIVFFMLLAAILVLAALMVRHARTPKTRIDNPALDGMKKEQVRVAAAVDALPFIEGQLFLYSLESKGEVGDQVNTDKIFHGFTILGKTQITDENDKTALIHDFTKSIRENTNTIGMCFNPRHGLRVVIGSNNYDFVICFECLQVQTYGFNQNRRILVSNSSNEAFNGFLDKYHLRKAE